MILYKSEFLFSFHSFSKTCTFLWNIYGEILFWSLNEIKIHLLYVAQKVDKTLEPFLTLVLVDF